MPDEIILRVCLSVQTRTVKEDMRNETDDRAREFIVRDGGGEGNLLILYFESSFSRAGVR